MHTQFSNNPLDVQTIYHHRSGCSTGFLLCPWLHVEQWRSAGDSIWFFEMSHHCTPFLSQSWSRRNTWEPATWTNWAWRPRQSLFTLWKCISMHMPIPSISKLSKPQTSFQNPVFGSSVWFPSKPLTYTLDISRQVLQTNQVDVKYFQKRYKVSTQHHQPIPNSKWIPNKVVPHSL